MKRNCPRPTARAITCLLIFVLAACRPAATQTPPTATPFPVFNYVSPTPQSVFLTEAVQSPTPGGSPTLDPDKVSLGQGRYVALACDSCHGADGKGTDKGSSLIGMTMSQDDFITLLRSGGKMGSSHQYSSNRLSEAGGENLYVYVLSLSQSK
jgi:hypothetical protein